MSIKPFAGLSVVSPTETAPIATPTSDFQLQLDALRTLLADRLLLQVGPLAWVLVDEALQPFTTNTEMGRISSSHIVALLRRLHGALPHSIDRDALINQLRQELLTGTV